MLRIAAKNQAPVNNRQSGDLITAGTYGLQPNVGISRLFSDLIVQICAHNEQKPVRASRRRRWLFCKIFGGIPIFNKKNS